MANSIEKGLRAEMHVARFLREKGFCILAHRYRTPFFEVDLFAEKQETLYLVEVKKVDKARGLFERVGARQQERILSTMVWLFEQKSTPVRWMLVGVQGERQFEVIYPLET